LTKSDNNGRYVGDDFRRTVVDRSTGQKVILSDEDIALANSLVKGKYSNPSYNPYEVNLCQLIVNIFGMKLFVNGTQHLKLLYQYVLQLQVDAIYSSAVMYENFLI